MWKNFPAKCFTHLRDVLGARYALAEPARLATPLAFATVTVGSTGLATVTFGHQSVTVLSAVLNLKCMYLGPTEYTPAPYRIDDDN